MSMRSIDFLYDRMGRTFTNTFGNRGPVEIPGLGVFEVEMIVQPGYSISPIRNDSSQTRDMWTISLRRSEILRIIGEDADIVAVMQTAVFPRNGKRYRIDDLADDTQIMIEGFLYELKEEVQLPTDGRSIVVTNPTDSRIRKTSGIL